MPGVAADAPAEWVLWLPTVNAALNSLATVLLILGYRLIRQRREAADKRTMLTAFAVSIAFLACYVVYHLNVGSVRFAGPQPVKTIYLMMLASHVILAATVPFLAVATIYLGLKDRRVAHRKVARWTFPIWLYVSITGVLIYLFLYHIYPAPRRESIIPEPGVTSAETSESAPSATP